MSADQSETHCPHCGRERADVSGRCWFCKRRVPVSAKGLSPAPTEEGYRNLWDSVRAAYEEKP